AHLFDNDRVKLDRKVFNPSRICKLYGTLARKGDPTPERPHRLSRIVKPIDKPTPVQKELLEAVAALAKPPVTPERARPHANNGAPGNLDRNQIYARAKKYMATMEPAVSGSGGHNQTFKVACRLIQGFDL